jgi:hypothetical protein
MRIALVNRLDVVGLLGAMCSRQGGYGADDNAGADLRTELAIRKR